MFVDKDEIDKFISIIIYVGIMKPPQLKMYWTINDGFYKSKERNILESIETIQTYLNKLLSKLYSPGANLAIDEGIYKI